MKLLKICNALIEYSFYALFLLVPLAFAGNTSELFEFNKMWLTFILTIIITSSWLAKMVLQKKIIVQRTSLDIPILLFLISQIISTVHSLDTHVSLWGYYSRFNGGLLSIISYIVLYYAFVSNSNYKMLKRLLKISLVSGLIVALWGLPSHFGLDPTCLLFRGTLDVSCWTNAFQPKVRIFSTLGQPDWLAAYLAVLIPISIAFFIQKTPIARVSENLNLRNSDFLISRVFQVWKPTALLLLIVLFYLDLLFTGSKSGFLGFWIGAAVLTFYIVFSLRKNIKAAFPVLAIIAGLIIITFIAGQPFGSFNKFTLPSIISSFSQKTSSAQNPKSANMSTDELGGTDSGKIRLIVWKGALDIWRRNPIFGTGVETFAFAYYRYKPKEHNLTSEWDFLYNKAHNEYLNYLATTGAFGLGSYLLMIGWFLFGSFSLVMLNLFQHPNQTGPRNKFGMTENNVLSFALIASYISILVSNFFGFSVVIVNIYLFMIPAFVFVLQDMLNPKQDNRLGFARERKNTAQETSLYQQFLIMIIAAASFYLIESLIVFWIADTNYALGYNLDHANDYQRAYPLLQTAVSQRGNEPVFQDELSQNEATLALLSSQEKLSTQAGALAQNAIAASDNVVNNHPNNVVFWKTRTRVFYILSQIDPQYFSTAINSLKKAYTLAPTDVKISYDLGVLYGQSGNDQKAIEFLKHTIYLKPDYYDAYYALGLFYHDMAIDKTGKVVNRQLQEKAVSEMNKILTKFSSSDAKVKQTLKEWQNL